VGQQVQMLGFYLAGFLCLVFAVLKLTIEGHWSWWRVLLPLLVVVGHNVVYIAVGFVWLALLGSEDATTREIRRWEIYQLSSMLCVLVVLDNLLRRIGGPGESAWWWLASGRWEVIILFGVLSLGCQLLFWSGVVRTGNGRTHGEE
jgi:hypothetical protein